MRIIKSFISLFTEDSIATRGSRISMLTGFFLQIKYQLWATVFAGIMLYAYFILQQLESTVNIHVAFLIQVLGLNKLKRQSRSDKCKDMLWSFLARQQLSWAPFLRQSIKRIFFYCLFQKQQHIYAKVHITIENEFMGHLVSITALFLTSKYELPYMVLRS